MSRRFVHRKSSATSAPPRPADVTYWAPGVHITHRAALDLQVVHDILSTLDWTVCAAVEERTKTDGCHSHIMIWAPQIPARSNELKWSARQLADKLGKWPHLVPVVTENAAVHVTAYLCKQALPALLTTNADVMHRWMHAVYDKSCALHQRAVIDSPDMCESYNAQVRRIRDGWNLDVEQ